MRKAQRVRCGVMTLAALLLLLSGAPNARAQTANRALAEELFRQGQSLMEKSRYAEACPKFAESQRLDPGTGTLLNLALCHEKEGKLASAWSEYNEVVALAQRDNRPDRVSYAEQRLAAIQPKLSRLTIEVAPGADLPGLKIELDGGAVGRPSIGVAVPVDPGPHKVTASAPHRHAWDTTVQVGTEPSTQSIVVPVLAKAPESAGDAAPGASGFSDRPKSNGKTQRTIAYVLGGLGIVGVGVGTVFGLTAISKNDTSNEQGCVDNRCPPAAAETRESAQSAGNVSTVAFAVGGAALAAGVVLLFTAPSNPKQERGVTAARLSLGGHTGSVTLEAAW